MTPPTMERNSAFTDSRLLSQKGICLVMQSKSDVMTLGDKKLELMPDDHSGVSLNPVTTDELHSPVVARLSDVLDVVFELGLEAARPERDDDPVVQRQRDPLAVAAHRQRRHAVRLTGRGPIQ